MEASGNTDRALLACFAARRAVVGPEDEVNASGTSAAHDAAGAGGPLVEAPDAAEFIEAACARLSASTHAEILRLAVGFVASAGGEAAEASFISLYAALESVLTFFRHESERDILPPEDFSRLERDLKRWLKEHPLLAGQSAKRALIYEKIRELNRFPAPHVFRRFCERYGLDLSDLWPVMGRAEDWPLGEIRHRLIHGYPFASRPADALACAREHMRWAVERMLLAVLGWPVARSRVSPERLSAAGGAYLDWRAERARFA